ncbi:MAG: MarR family transcriptional regulator [Clostridia bacterium]|nr:MarR family transcriptional regulator [Clostridia bacterium]
MNRTEALDTYVMLTKLMMSMNHPLSSRHNTTFTTPQLYTLVKLHECGELNMTQIAQIIMVTNQAMTGITNKLVNDGYVERVYLPENRRQILLRLTPQGQTYMDEFYRAMDDVFAQIFSDCTDEELIEMGYASKTIIKVLSKIHNQFGQNYMNHATRIISKEE